MDRYQTTFNTWNKIANLYQEKFMDLDLYNDTYDLLCEQLTKSNPQLLELACGPGNITRYLLNKRPDFNIHATDIAPNMVALAKQNVPQASFAVMDVRDLSQLSSNYDAIVCGFCMPYLSKEDIVQLLQDAHTKLLVNGLIYCSTIAGDYEQSAYEAGSSGDQCFVYYHSAYFLEQNLSHAGFTDIQCIKKVYPKGDQEDIHLIFIARKA